MLQQGPSGFDQILGQFEQSTGCAEAAEKRPCGFETLHEECLALQPRTGVWHIGLGEGVKIFNICLKFCLKENVPYGMPVAKVNGNMHYRLSDLHHPYQHSANPPQQNPGNPNVFKRKWGQCYTITPDAAIKERIDQLDAQNKLKVDNQNELIDNNHKFSARNHCRIAPNARPISCLGCRVQTLCRILC